MKNSVKNKFFGNNALEQKGVKSIYFGEDLIEMVRLE